MSEDKEKKDQDPRRNPYTLKGFFNILKGGSVKKNEGKENEKDGKIQ